MEKVIQKLIRWMPVILFVLLLMVDRGNTFHVVGFITLLLAYTAILIMRILYAKDRWHREYDASELGSDASIQKMSDLNEKLVEQDGTAQKS